MQADLRRRVLSAVVMIPSVAVAVLTLGTWAFAVGIVFLAALGAWEWAGLAGWTARWARLAYGGATVLVLWLVLMGVGPTRGGLVLAAIGVGWWCVALAWVIRYQHSGEVGALRFAPAAGLVLIASAAGALVALHAAASHGPRWVMFLLVLVWTADTAAYFVGRRWGARRLAPRVSPGKTWEGVLGGLVAVGVLAAATGSLVGQPHGTLLAFVGLCVGTALISVLGDLTESMFKRRAGLKDSGALIPGHGGVLDRIDSLCAAAPVFALGLKGLGSVT